MTTLRGHEAVIQKTRRKKSQHVSGISSLLRRQAGRNKQQD